VTRDNWTHVGTVLKAIFADLEQLEPGGYLAYSPAHRPEEGRIVLFDEEGCCLGCSCGECSRGDLWSAAMLRRAEAA